MKVAVVLGLICVACAQTDFFRVKDNRFGKQKSSSPSKLKLKSRSQPRVSTSSGSSRQSDVVDNTLGENEYHYSWRHTGKHTKWDWSGAVNYCRGLGGGWEAISINDASENGLVTSALGRENIDYIWTGGRRSGRGWKWPKGAFKDLAWSHTGGFRKPQPDNREGNEDCLSVLNNVYRDGIKWHDVACSHRKPIICERSRRS